MRLGSEIRRHARQYNLTDTALAQLQDRVIRVGTVDLMRIGYGGLTIIDVLLVLGHPVSAGALLKPGLIHSGGTLEHFYIVHGRFEGTAVLPLPPDSWKCTMAPMLALEEIQSAPIMKP